MTVIIFHNLFMFISCFFATNDDMTRLVSDPSCMTCHIMFTVSKMMFIRFIMLMGIFHSAFHKEVLGMSMRTNNLCWLFLISISYSFSSKTNAEKTHHIHDLLARWIRTHHLIIVENKLSQMTRHLSSLA